MSSEPMRLPWNAGSTAAVPSSRRRPACTTARPWQFAAALRLRSPRPLLRPDPHPNWRRNKPTFLSAGGEHCGEIAHAGRTACAGTQSSVVFYGTALAKAEVGNAVSVLTRVATQTAVAIGARVTANAVDATAPFARVFAVCTSRTFATTAAAASEHAAHGVAPRRADECQHTDDHQRSASGLPQRHAIVRLAA